SFLALVTGSLAKIAFDVMLMMQNEVGEAFEPFVTGRGGSSTMPQKRNPISSELIVAAAKAVRQHAGLMLDAMVQDLERATGPWHAEWIAIPESFVLASGALHQAKHMLGGLEVDEARMRKNLDLTRGLIVAEAVMMGLAPHLGRQTAHDVVYEACRKALADGLSLADALRENPTIAGALSADEITRLCDPANYLGSAPAIVDAVVLPGASCRVPARRGARSLCDGGGRPSIVASVAPRGFFRRGIFRRNPPPAVMPRVRLTGVSHDAFPPPVRNRRCGFGPCTGLW